MWPPSADAAVADHIQFAAYCVGHLGDQIQDGGCAVELAAAVVGEDDSVHSLLGG